MIAIVLDASVAVKLVSEEPGSDAALRCVSDADRIIAPDWMMLEAAHALWKKSHGSQGDKEVVAAGIEALGRIVDHVVPATDLLAAAMSLSFLLQHPIYDCLYLALAEAEQATVMTADEKFARAAAAAGYGGKVEVLAR